MFATVPPPPKRLLVFARVPEHGRVKTRLGAAVGSEQALAVYRAMLHDVLTSIGGPDPDTAIEVLWAPTENADHDSLPTAFGDRSLAMQTGRTLGDRLAMAFSERFFFHRTDKIVAIGVDDPRLSRELIEHAFALLDGCDWVLGPLVDGGYYLVGCRGPSFNSDVFRGIEWGTSTVLTSTLEKIREWQNTLAVLPFRHDIDLAADLERFVAEDAEPSGRLATLLRQSHRAADTDIDATTPSSGTESS